MIRTILFILASGGIVIFSFPSLRNPRSHGFFRFFAFETLLVLTLTNVGSWFIDPFSIAQVVSWILLGCSVFLAIYGFYLLRVIGRPQGNLESTTRLVIIGAYKYIRHPLYSSLLLLAWGVCLKDPGLFSIVLALVTSVFLYATARAEEAENLAKFGHEYESYRQFTKMFIPRLF